MRDKMIVMKKTSILIATILALAIPMLAFAKDKAATFTGEMKCAKCTLKTKDHCQNVLQVDVGGGKTVNYYLEENDVSKNFHEKVCHGPKKAKITGVIHKRMGKDNFAFIPSKIEEVN